MSGEKCLSVVFPFQAKMFSTIKNAKIGSSIAVAFWGIFHLQWLFLVKTVKRHDPNRHDRLSCEYLISRKYAHFYHLFDNVVYSLLPCMLIFLFNIIIIVKLALARHRSKHANQPSAVSKSAISTTLMLLSVSVTFCVLTCPIAVYYLIFLDYSAIIEMKNLTTFLYYTNHSFNAIMYTLISPRFRREIKKSPCRSFSSENSMSNAGNGNKVGPSDTRETHLSG